MKQVFIISAAAILASCSQMQQNQDNSTTNTDSTIVVHSIKEQPAKTIIDFVKWYSKQDLQGGLVKNASTATHDSTKFYAVNFENTEKYLTALKSSGFISDQYVDSVRGYFKKCDEAFKKHPENAGPPDGFDFDLVMQSQETDEDLQFPDSAKLLTFNAHEQDAMVGVRFKNGNQLRYTLTKNNNAWLIDKIEQVNNSHK